MAEREFPGVVMNTYLWMTIQEGAELEHAFDRCSDALEDCAEVLTMIGDLLRGDHADPNKVAAMADLVGEAMTQTANTHGETLRGMRDRLRKCVQEAAEGFDEAYAREKAIWLEKVGQEDADH